MNMGAVSLLPHVMVLKKYQSNKNFQLVICSNDEQEFNFLKESGIEFEFVEWSFRNIFTQLNRSTAVLVTTGNDELCATKSANRILLSLGSKQPVIAINFPNSKEFFDIIPTKLELGLTRYFIDKEYQKNIKTDLEKAKKL